VFHFHRKKAEKLETFFRFSVYLDYYIPMRSFITAFIQTNNSHLHRASCCRCQYHNGKTSL